MISKFKKITNFALFKNFDWNQVVIGEKGEVIDFGETNIIFGRNYSGKTTLSRIIRSMQTGIISDKYENPDFCVLLNGGKECSLNKLSDHNEIIRVFNQDFVRENLKFISNPDDGISSFAIVGEENNKVEEEITKILAEIGSNESENETGLYSELKTNTTEYKLNLDAYEKAKNTLEGKLNQKATDRTIGIKYNPQKYGDQNYTIVKLKNEIDRVLASTYISLQNNEKDILEKLILEQLKAEIIKFKTPNFKISVLLANTNLLITQKVGNSEKIKDLVNSAILNKWASEGFSIHKENHLAKCSFCGNDITNERWKELEAHFDDESRLLEQNIDKLIYEVTSHRKEISSIAIFDKELFYSKFQSEVVALSESIKNEITTYLSNLDELHKSLKFRKDNILNIMNEINIADNFSSIEEILNKYEEIRIKSNSFSDELGKEQSLAKERLRLDEISNYLIAIDYSQKKVELEAMESKRGESEKKVSDTNAKIREKEKEIADLKMLLKDEKIGVAKVNEYINNFFGHKFITISLKELSEDEKIGDKKYKFEILRDNKKAYHLSEGECSLISFCYFLARLDDVETKNKNPIIWIDDPISSLDNNHIFFVYSLIKSEIIDSKKCKQLFISTHNLDFLKYLKRLTDRLKFFIVERQISSAIIKVMPNYLKNCASEFNYLFQQIYDCSNITTLTDKNYHIVYNYGNNARKFMELYLYYKFPNGKNSDKDTAEKLKLFFGDNIPAILTNRINNEYSHLAGTFERGTMPIEVQEILDSAKRIVEEIKNKDLKQYEHLLESMSIS